MYTTKDLENLQWFYTEASEEDRQQCLADVRAQGHDVWAVPSASQVDYFLKRENAVRYATDLEKHLKGAVAVNIEKLPGKQAA